MRIFFAFLSACLLLSVACGAPNTRDAAAAPVSPNTAPVAPTSTTAGIALESGVQLLEAPEFQARAQTKRNAAILDLRSAREFEQQRLAHATHFPCPNADCDALWQGLDRESEFFIYCSNGYQSTLLANRMAKNGFKNLFVLKNGVIGWVNSGNVMTRVQ